MYSKLNRQQQEIVMKQAIVREACNNTNVLEGLSLLTKYRNLQSKWKWIDLWLRMRIMRLSVIVVRR